MSLIYENLTNKIIRCIYDIHNTLGVGYDEETYHQGLIYIFQKEQIPYLSKQNKDIVHREISIKKIEYDLMVFDKIILELKSIQSDFLQTNYVQIISYLKLWQRHLGLMVNFGLPRANIKRILFIEKEKTVSENYDYIKSKINLEERKFIKIIRQVLLNILDMHGSGYGELVYRKIVEIELEHQKLVLEKAPCLEVKYDNNVLKNYQINHSIIQHSIILGIDAIQDEISF